MGLVYKGRHETLGRCAAIKTLLPRNTLDSLSRERLLREAQTQALIRHENVVAVYDLIPENGTLFIAMEYVEGETLAALLQRNAGGRLSIDGALPIITQMLAALEHVHGRKVVHRDVKPSNVLVCKGLVKLADFGIALMPDAPRLTAAEQRIGTREYMSPEQLQGSELDYRTDIYSSGVVLYTMLAGHTPFPSREILPALGERMAGPPDFREIDQDLPAGVWEVLCTALQMEPERRFRSAAAFACALKDAAAGFLHPSCKAEEEMATEILRGGPAAAESVATDTEPPRRPLVPWLVIAGSLAASGYVLIQHVTQFPIRAPGVTSARVVPILPPVELTTTTVVATPHTPEPGPPVTATESVIPVDPGRSHHEDPEDRQRQEVRRLRQEIQEAIDRAESALHAEQFDRALEELESAAQKAQSYPDDFWQERVALLRLRTEIVEARVAAATRVQEDALWAKRIADVEEDLRREHWPEAERFAKQIAEDAHAPPAVAERAKALLQQAKEGRIAAFRQLQLGPTTNTIRKPSTPPRKNN